MKNLLIISFTLISLFASQENFAQNNYGTATAKVSFFSEAPIQNIDAYNDKVNAELNTSNNEVIFMMKMSDFKFTSKKMERDAQTKYLETAKYTEASFKGKIDKKIDYTKNGTYPVTVSGKLKIHGVEKDVTENGTVAVKNGQVVVQSDFTILLKDYNIETPKIAFQKMTKDNVIVKITATLSGQAKNTASAKE